MRALCEINDVIRRELSQLFGLALPMILTQLSQMGMGVADTIMAGRGSAADLAGVALGGNLFWPDLTEMTSWISRPMTSGDVPACTGPSMDR